MWRGAIQGQQDSRDSSTPHSPKICKLALILCVYFGFPHKIPFEEMVPKLQTPLPELPHKVYCMRRWGHTEAGMSHQGNEVTPRQGHHTEAVTSHKSREVTWRQWRHTEAGTPCLSGPGWHSWATVAGKRPRSAWGGTQCWLLRPLVLAQNWFINGLNTYRDDTKTKTPDYQLFGKERI